MMKKLALSMGILTMLSCCANDKAVDGSLFSGKYWGLFVPYVKTDAGSDKKEYLAVVIYFQKDTLSIVSASGTFKTKYDIVNGIIKYHERNGKYLIERRLFYDRKQNVLYHEKPGFWYFIPQKIIYVSLSADVARKTIEAFQKNEYHKFQTEASPGSLKRQGDAP